MTDIPWKLACPWCKWYIAVNGRGASRNDPGSGVEAARLMGSHVHGNHEKTWKDFLEAKRG